MLCWIKYLRKFVFVNLILQHIPNVSHYIDSTFAHCRRASVSENLCQCCANAGPTLISQRWPNARVLTLAQHQYDNIGSKQYPAP